MDFSSKNVGCESNLNYSLGLSAPECALCGAMRWPMLFKDVIGAVEPVNTEYG